MPSHSLRSGSAIQAATARCVAAHWRARLRASASGVNPFGGHSRFRSHVVVAIGLDPGDECGVERRDAVLDPLQGDPVVLEDGPVRAQARPAAVQSTCTWPASVGIEPCSSSMWVAPTWRTRPIRTTCPMLLSVARSESLRIAPRKKAGSTAGSRRRSTPASSIRGHRSRRSVAAALASFMAASHCAKPADEPQRLDRRPVVGPRIAGTDPPDGVGIDAVVDEPAAGVHGGLARPDDREPRRRV